MKTNPTRLAALSLAAQIRARIETGIVPYIPAEAETVAGLLEDLGGELQVTHEQYEAMAETIGELQERIAELEGWVEESEAAYRRLTEAACRELEGVR